MIPGNAGQQFGGDWNKVQPTNNSHWRNRKKKLVRPNSAIRTTSLPIFFQKTPSGVQESSRAIQLINEAIESGDSRIDWR